MHVMQSRPTGRTLLLPLPAVQGPQALWSDPHEELINCLPCGGAADAAAKLLPVTRAEQRALLLEAQYYGETCSRQCGCLHSG